MKNADNRNIMAPSKSPSFKVLGKLSSPSLSTAKLKAANVPGAEAFLMGLMNFSRSSLISTRSPNGIIHAVGTDVLINRGTS
jgi:hypothetical protein